MVDKIQKLKELGYVVTEADFKPKDKMAEIESALVELADMMDNAITEHENALVELADMLTESEAE